MSNERVAGIVLAAGRSRRMGAPKPLLTVEGRTFVRAAVETLRGGGCGSVVVVVAGPEAGAEASDAGAVMVEGRPDAEQVDSLRTALEHVAAEIAAVLVLPVDHPLVRTTTVRELITASGMDPDAVIRPVYRGRPGHPTLFPRAFWTALRDPALLRGARSVVESPGTRTVDVDVDDPGVVADIDTPAAYRRYVGEQHDPPWRGGAA